jgi:hypothetical protein
VVKKVAHPDCKPVVRVTNLRLHQGDVDQLASAIWLARFCVEGLRA